MADSRDIKVTVTQMRQEFESAPVIYVDGATNTISAEGVVRFNLFTDKMVGYSLNKGEYPPDGSPIIERSISARVVMSEAGFKRLAKWAAEIVQKMERQEN